MGNQNTSHFERLKDLPSTLSDSQCVLYKHEILICGGFRKENCYSYHTIKNKYKFICDYPSNIELYGHCVVKLIDNKNEITLLSFGGSIKHTLMMKHASIWDNNNKIKKSNNYNQWIPFTDNHNNQLSLEEIKIIIMECVQ
ncbi:hypothetical protein RFI_06623 [Reticulomyxa filosa]|uniref:Uncharacterized protein n=1 Tax=Reticulomyxa filosa TaxID=46433 RepID=X6NYZ5_RETFI|nr:hypothetical protein RFI_06623 [Reticulomyxa filosa]|eukprot:ETO30497.1 hypothetical protein RFI_06623 [Reticulomyxa filosa]